MLHRLVSQPPSHLFRKVRVRSEVVAAVALSVSIGSVVLRDRGAALTFDLVKPALRAPGQHILIVLIAKHAARPSCVTSGASAAGLWKPVTFKQPLVH